MQRPRAYWPPSPQPPQPFHCDARWRSTRPRRYGPSSDSQPRACAACEAVAEMAAEPPGVRLSVDLDDPQAVPYFLWDEPMSVAELRARLASAGEAERLRLLGKILREALAF